MLSGLFFMVTFDFELPIDKCAAKMIGIACLCDYLLEFLYERRMTFHTIGDWCVGMSLRFVKCGANDGLGKKSHDKPQSSKSASNDSLEVPDTEPVRLKRGIVARPSCYACSVSQSQSSPIPASGCSQSTAVPNCDVSPSTSRPLQTDNEGTRRYQRAVLSNSAANNVLWSRNATQEPIPVMNVSHAPLLRRMLQHEKDGLHRETFPGLAPLLPAVSRNEPAGMNELHNISFINTRPTEQFCSQFSPSALRYVSGRTQTEHSCPLCPFIAHDSYLFVNHVVDEHCKPSNLNVVCVLCSIPCATKDSLKMHILNRHTHDSVVLSVKGKSIKKAI